MAVTIMLKGPNKTVATLTKEQADIANPVLVDMMNKEITRKKAEEKIALLCEQAGIPLAFEAQ